MNIHTPRICSTPRRMAGVTLIEVLMAVVIIAFGLLALTGMQLVSKRNVLDASQRTTAAHLAQNLFEVMRANSTTDALETYLFTAQQGLGRQQQGSAPSQDCSSTSCNPQQLARYDVWVWEQQLDGASELYVDGTSTERTGGLINANACLTGPAGGGTGIYALTIAWRGSIALPSASADPQCGDGLSLYGTNEEFRRMLTLRTYIVAR
jgi:type IV pilus assembly protein PilV